MSRKNYVSVVIANLLCLFMFALTAHATEEGTLAATNHTVLRSDNAVFVADGTSTGFDAATLAAPLVVAGSDFIEAQVFVERYRSASGDEELRIYFSVHDISDSSSAIEDTIEFIFDRRHDHGNSSADTAQLDEDVMIRIERSADCNPCNVARVMRSGILNEFAGSGTSVSLANSAVLVNNAGEYSGAPAGFDLGWTGSLVIEPSDLQWSNFPQVMGFAVRVTSGNQNAIDASNPLPTSPPTPVASYPLNGANVVTETDPIHWANLKMRYPIEYAISLDYSGSMSATDGDVNGRTRWERAKRATDLFVATLGLFKDEHDVIDDLISVSQYSWGCGGGGIDSTGNVSGVSGDETSIPDPPTSGSYTEGNMNNPPDDNCTPILRGIEYALNDQLNFSSPGSELRDRIILLLSDGFHNTPSATSETFIADPGSFFSVDEKAYTQIRTVAMLPDGNAGNDLLSAISTEFHGGIPYMSEAKYTQTNNFNELMEAFIETLNAPLAINQVAKVLSDYNPGAPDKLVFIGVWDNNMAATDLIITEGGSPTTGTSIVNTDIGYAAFIVNDSTPNVSWQLGVGAGQSLPDSEFLLADLRILARYLIEQKPYYTGDKMLLQVSLKDNGQAILGATVNVEIAKPGEGLGDYLSTVQENCEPGVPQIPALPGHDRPEFQFRMLSQGNVTTTHAATVGTMATTGAASSATTGQAGDPPPSRYVLAAYHFERCQKQGLDRNNLPGMQMYDDGTHGDPIAGDGVYSLSYLLDEEGSYNIRYFALGQTTDGVKFSRTRRISQYAGIRPDEEATQTETQNLGISDGLINYAVYFLPKDSLGNYMGPGFKTKFKLTTSSGVLASDIVDLNNGYYGQLIRYAQGSPEPTVTITTTDGSFEKVVGEDAKPPIDKLVWILLLIILLLFVLWIVCLLRKKS